MQVHLVFRIVALLYASGNFWNSLLTEVVPVCDLGKSVRSDWYKIFPYLW